VRFYFFNLSFCLRSFLSAGTFSLGINEKELPRIGADKNFEGFPPYVPPGWKRIGVDECLREKVDCVEGRVEGL
jgi:hypothetical protein